MLNGQIYFFSERTIGTIKKITYKKFFLDFEKSDAAVTIEITYKKIFGFLKNLTWAGHKNQKFFCPQPNIYNCQQFCNIFK